jgi:phenylpyruvate tautomerase PptA (4-oxalocrotonate tautomerase family)
MPLIRVSLLAGVFSDEQRQQMVMRLADTMAEVVGEPYPRLRGC